MSIATQKPIGYLQLVRQNPNFRYLWLGQVVSLLGDWFNLIASAILVDNLTGSGFAVAGLLVVRTLSQFVMGPIGGLLADRLNRKNILIVTDLLRAAFVLGFLLVDGPEDVWLLYVLTACQLGTSGIFVPTKDAILPDITADKEVGTANALNATTWSTMLALGAALGGLVAGEWGLRPAFLVDSLTFLVSAVLIARVDYLQTTSPDQPVLSFQHVFRQYFSGFAYLKRNPEIFLIAIQKGFLTLAITSGFEVLQVQLASQRFQIGENGSTALGLMYASVGLGTGVSPLLARIWTGDREVRLRWAIAVGYLFAAAGLLTVSSLLSFPTVLFGTFVRGFGVAIVWVFSTTLLLKKLPNQIRGRVFGSEYALFTLLSAIGTPIAGSVLDSVNNPEPPLLWGMAGLSLLFGLVWLAGGVLRHPRGPAAPAARSVGS
jgi:MFS family permease